MKACLQCQSPFEINSKEKEFLVKVRPTIAAKTFDLPEPKLCPSCRRQRRYTFRNDRNFYRRACSKTGRTIISIYSPDKTFPVYARDVWWSDAYDPQEYGREFDFNRPFFEQFADLQKVVPRAASVIVNSENCDYTAFGLQNRNCYLTSRLAESEDIYYTYLSWKSRNCFDCYDILECELCYECIDCRNCYHCIFTERSRACHDTFFCADLSGSSNCFGCVGLVQKKYHFFNEALSKEEYEKRVQEWWPQDQKSLARCLKAFNEHQKKYPVRATNVFHSENVTGSYIFQSRNVDKSFDIVNCEDALHCTQSEFSKDIMDCDMAYQAEQSYEVIGEGNGMSNAFSFGLVGGDSNVYYSIEINNNNHNLFGCIGMKNSHHCVLNKHYTKDEYETLVPRIIEHMQKTGEWGEFFPIQLSQFGYNETCAQSLIPLEKATVLAYGWKWHEREESSVAQAEVDNVIKCEQSGRPFRLIPQELQFYKEMGLPPPVRHPDVRHFDRLAKRNPYRLRKTICRKCSKEVWTDQVSDDRIIYCEACYLAHVY